MIAAATPLQPAPLGIRSETAATPRVTRRYFRLNRNEVSQ